MNSTKTGFLPTRRRKKRRRGSRRRKKRSLCPSRSMINWERSWRRSGMNKKLSTRNGWQINRIRTDLWLLNLIIYLCRKTTSQLKRIIKLESCSKVPFCSCLFWWWSSSTSWKRRNKRIGWVVLKISPSIQELWLQTALDLLRTVLCFTSFEKGSTMQPKLIEPTDHTMIFLLIQFWYTITFKI